MIIALVAFVTNLFVLLFLRIQGEKIVFSSKGLIFIIAIGVAAACVDLFALFAYSKGLKLSSSFITGATSASIVLLTSFIYFREPFNIGRIIGIIFIIIGIFILQRYGI